MADTDRIKRNLSKMIDGGAPSEEVDAYMASEGFKSPAEWKAALTPKAAAPDPVPAGTQVARAVGQGAIGVNDSIANTVGAPVDAAAWALRQAGMNIDKPIGGSESIKSGIDYVATLPGRVGDAVTQGSLSPLTEDRTSRFEPANKTEKIARGVGEGVGNALSVAMPAAAIANTARAGTMTSGVANALATQPITQAVAGGTAGGVTAATDNPWYGLAAGVAVPVAASVARGVISPATTRLSPQEQRLVQTADREGIPLTPAQRTGSKGLKAIEDTMAKVPGASGPMNRTLDNQRQAFNRAGMQRTGQIANDASPETLDRAFQIAGQNFDDLAARTTLNVDNQFVADVTRAANEYGRRLETNVAPIFQSYMDDLAPLLQAAQTGGNPQIAGEIYGTIRSDIGKTIRANGKNPDLQRALGAVQNALDDAVERSSAGPLRAEWQEARRQYQALITIDKAMQGGTQADRSAGNIPLGALKNAVKQSDPRGYARGRGQLNELSRVGDYIGQRTPDSGTATREAIINPLAWPVMAAGNVLSRAYNSGPGQAYLTNQLAGQTQFGANYAAQAAREMLNRNENALARGGR